MADNDDKTEEPTDRKLQKAREEGNVPKSEDFNGFLGLFLGIIMLFFLNLMYTDKLLFTIGGCFESVFISNPDLTITDKCQLYLSVVIEMAILIFIGGIFGSTLGYLILSKGFVISKQPIKFNVDALNIGKNLTNLFNKENATSLGISLFKETLYYGTFFFIITYFLPPIAYQTFCFENCGGESPLLFVYTLVGTYILISFIFAAIDVPLKVTFWKNKLKMSHKDIKDEHKETEGAPEVKQSQREFRDEILQGAPSGPKNATFFVKGSGMIFGIRYNKEESPAPIIVAVGKQTEKAIQIESVARAMRRLVIQDDDFVRALGGMAVNGRPVPLEFVKDLRKCIMQLRQHEEQFGPVHPAK